MEIKKAIRMSKQDMSECVPEETLSHWEAEASLRTAFAGGNANDFVVRTVYRRAYSVNELAWLWTDDHSISPNSETRDLAWEEILDAARIILSILLVALLTLGTPSSALVSTCIAKWTSMTWTICAIPRRTTKRPTASSVRVERVTKAIIQQSSSTPGRTPVGLLVRAQPITPYSYAGAEED